MRIVVLADSMAMPRLEQGCMIYWDDTWPYLLEQSLRNRGIESEVINCASRSRTADTLTGLDFLEHIIWKRPQAIILQVGIVDCTPRVFSKREKKLLNYPFVPARLRDWLVNYRSARRPRLVKRNPLGKVDTPPEKFRDFLAHFFSKVTALESDIQLIVLPVVANIPMMEMRSPGYGENVRLYNDILKSCSLAAKACWLDPGELFAEAEVRNHFCADGYHLNEAGTRRIAAAIGSLLMNRLVKAEIEVSDNE